MQIKTFFDPRTFTLTYLVWDPATRDAVVIDPVLDFDPASGKVWTESADVVADFAEAEGLSVHYSLETHAHADHLSGAGSLTVQTIHTPGHTPACVTWHIEDAVFTGDALFMPDFGTGRCDFPAGSAEDLYDSVTKRLYTLPDATRVFVGHDYQPGGRELAWETTIGASKAANKQLTAETKRDEFVSWRQARDATLSAPRLLLPSIQVNIEAGRLPEATEDGRRFLKIPLTVKES